MAKKSHPITLLLVDDSNGRDIEPNMRLLGYSVILFERGRDAMEAIENGIRYDVAAIDLSMYDGLCRNDGTDGEDIIRLSKKLNPRVPVASISGYPEKSSMSDAHFQKPFNENDLDFWIRGYIRR